MFIFSQINWQLDKQTIKMILFTQDNGSKVQKSRFAVECQKHSWFKKFVLRERT